MGKLFRSWGHRTCKTWIIVIIYSYWFSNFGIKNGTWVGADAIGGKFFFCSTRTILFSVQVLEQIVCVAGGTLGQFVAGVRCVKIKKSVMLLIALQPIYQAFVLERKIKKVCRNCKVDHFEPFLEYIRVGYI